MRRRTVLAAGGAAVVAPVVAPALTKAAAVEPSAQAGWQLRWAPEAGVHGLGAFEGVEDDRANSHPAGQPHIFVEGNNYRFNMHMVDRDTMTDRQRQEVKGMRWNGSNLILLNGQRWRLTHQMFIPTSLRATTSFTHIMQTKAPGVGSLPMLVMSLRRHGSIPKIEFRALEDNVTIGVVDLAPLQERWIDVEVEMLIGDAATGRTRWVLRNGASTVIDVTRSVDNWLTDRVRPKWGIYRSLNDSSGSLQNCYLLVRNMRAYQWSDTAPPVGAVYEAENAVISQGAVESNHSGYTGTGFVNLDNVVGSYVQWTVNAAAAGTATLTFRYANGTTATRPMDIRVNGALVADEFGFIPTPAWNDWDTRTIANVPLAAGANTVRAASTTSTGGPNLDHLEVQISAPSGTDNQAENATIAQGAVESNHAGYTGTGFVNFTNVAGSYIQFAVAGPATNLAVRYANGSTADRPMNLTINGVPAGLMSFPPTGAWTSWATASRAVSLNAGSNTLRLTSAVSSGGPNLDKITLS